MVTGRALLCSTKQRPPAAGERQSRSARKRWGAGRWRAQRSRGNRLQCRVVRGAARAICSHGRWRLGSGVAKPRHDAAAGDIGGAGGDEGDAQDRLPGVPTVPVRPERVRTADATGAGVLPPPGRPDGRAPRQLPLLLLPDADVRGEARGRSTHRRPGSLPLRPWVSGGDDGGVAGVGCPGAAPVAALPPPDKQGLGHRQRGPRAPRAPLQLNLPPLSPDSHPHDQPRVILAIRASAEEGRQSQEEEERKEEAGGGLHGAVVRPRPDEESEACEEEKELRNRRNGV
mmetsp:Transcript_23634/g.56500  ORF Transcript_23634/g.56500 Transcript_23634/m.56500 type:complete len:286 (-) Transcript_23634:20-877(-)